MTQILIHKPLQRVNCHIQLSVSWYNFQISARSVQCRRSSALCLLKKNQKIIRQNEMRDRIIVRLRWNKIFKCNMIRQCLTYTNNIGVNNLVLNLECKSHHLSRKERSSKMHLNWKTAMEYVKTHSNYYNDAKTG